MKQITHVLGPIENNYNDDDEREDDERYSVTLFDNEEVQL